MAACKSNGTSVTLDAESLLRVLMPGKYLNLRGFFVSEESVLNAKKRFVNSA